MVSEKYNEIVKDLQNLLDQKEGPIKFRALSFSEYRSSGYPAPFAVSPFILAAVWFTNVEGQEISGECLVTTETADEAGLNKAAATILESAAAALDKFLNPA